MAKRGSGGVAGPEKVEGVREALISWFRENARDLPWHRTRCAWRVLVSQVMLQQMQVARAVSFYERFALLKLAARLARCEGIEL